MCEAMKILCQVQASMSSLIRYAFAHVEPEVFSPRLSWQGLFCSWCINCQSMGKRDHLSLMSGQAMLLHMSIAAVHGIRYCVCLTTYC